MEFIKKILVTAIILIICPEFCSCWYFGVAVSMNAGGGQSKEKIYLTDIQNITLRKGENTTSRRLFPIPQLRCVGGSSFRNVEPDLVHCYIHNITNRTTVEWFCKPENPIPGYEFGSTNVSCEGYDKPDDPYILVGSCGLEYTLRPSYNASSLDDMLELALVCIGFMTVVGFLIFFYFPFWKDKE